MSPQLHGLGPYRTMTTPCYMEQSHMFSQQYIIYVPYLEGDKTIMQKCNNTNAERFSIEIVVLNDLPDAVRHPSPVIVQKQL